MQLRSCRLTIRFSYPHVIDLRDMIKVIQDNAYIVPRDLPPSPPGSIVIGSFTASKDSIVFEFNNSSGVMSFSVSSFDEIPKAVSDFKEIVKELRLGDIDFIELVSEILVKGNLKLDCKLFGKELSGFEITEENSLIRLSNYPALRNTYVLTIIYKFKEIGETDKFLSETKKVIDSVTSNIS
ncbi:hypothetical protein [Sulfolobus acidocaldarius]|uniref:Uncharacterized protein n=4 Tax=Sulfolobus acidocaldarius TaxID=2285 RepID=Q4J7C1_SULAC|nr:hypothetical protein [Sulfolobus acidocaldarius]AAY81305.1 hypothetical protein Saci_2006 [Sulfolobus acidocaldarius DSM 639]AGE71945.1 hypothetical protein SacN8_09955 [Sulfolobus acidocaldarius N8]AGE74217.1 hypothetical protein SacRon12I_09975 [Sulfolobus acidocaldarius Ron12/I]ALU30620.1 hypothetical protein ATY89_08040 [Sulfolobus acidocaldarius]ALU32632.1 hypothetical protein ATZ20_11060 [Sulfolobus acidocaldarius]